VKLQRIEVFRANAGWKTHSFVKAVSDSEIVGWGEFSHDFGAVRATNPGMAKLVGEILQRVAGMEIPSAEMDARLRSFADSSAAARQIAGALKNALLDIEARHEGVPVHVLLGGAQRDRIPLYWAHCGTYRVSHASTIGTPPVRTLDDIRRLGAEVTARGYRALKCNLLLLGGDEPRRFKAERAGHLDDNTTAMVATELEALLAAFRDGAGPDVELLVDAGSGFPASAVSALARAAVNRGVRWLEVDMPSPSDLANVRAETGVAIATGERLMPVEYDAFLAARAADVMVLDVPFLGVRDSIAIAERCERHGVLVAPHNCYSPLATMMSAAFCAVVPNLGLMELDVDGVPWEDSFVTPPPVVRDGHLILSEGPGWGTEVNEEAVRAHAVD
jgi:L-alanine-DL-glutamate epimerase-like enolase superfamily enzyme